MKYFFPHLLILVLGVGSIIFVWSGTANQLSVQQQANTSTSVALSNDGYIVSTDSNTDGDVSSSDSEKLQHQTPFVRSNDEPTRVNGSGFRLTVPNDWIIEGYDGVPEDGQYGNMSFGKKPEDAYLSDEAVTINLMTFSRPVDLKKEISDRKMVSETTRQSMVEYFQKENPKIGLSTKDILLFDESQKPIGTFPVYRTGFQCLKSCYPEGLPPTRYSYFVDAGETIYQFDVFMNTSKNTPTLLKKTEAVIRSLVIEK